MMPSCVAFLSAPAMNDLKKINDLIDPQDGFVTFDQLRHENGQAFWLASELMERLGYDSMKAFYKAINRANKAMTGLGIDPFGNIQKITRPDGSEDYKLSRFASYLVVMNADTAKPQVGAVQAYFVAMTRQFELWLENPEDVTRVAFRQEMKEQHSRLSGAAKESGVVKFDHFQNAGYLGMYNMMNVTLANRRRIDKDELLDYMGSTEMAANLFRIEMTKARLERDGIVGQAGAEAIHQRVGSQVRSMVKDSTGKYPEELPVQRRLPDVVKQLKIGHKGNEKSGCS
jgi:DNA-damage-inducible protein D